MSTIVNPAAVEKPFRSVRFGTALRWEMTKVAAQIRSRVTLLTCVAAPIAVILVINGQAPVPSDTIYGRQVHTSGFAMPLLMLAFSVQWLFPVLAAIVAGDIFANEDQHGTWKTLLTRSVSRSQVFWAKSITAVAFNLLALLVLAATTIVGSMLIIGSQPLTGLTGQTIAPGHALLLVIASWGTAVAPLIGFTAISILLSVLTRNSAIGVAAPVVVGFTLQLVGTISGMNGARTLLLTTPFESWFGLLTQPRFYHPLAVGVVVGAAWTAVCLAIAYVSLRRRDITGG